MNPSHTSEVQVVSETTRREMQAAEAAAAEEKKTRAKRKDKADHQAPADTTTTPEKEA